MRRMPRTLMKKTTQKKFSSLLVGAAFAGLMAGTTTLTACGGDGASAERNGCNGPNGCGGHGKAGEKKDANGCNGPNGCSGHAKPAEKK
jgi:hypothetical protein